MTPDQIPQLITNISLADPRIMPSDTSEILAMAALWAAILKDVPPEYAMNAVGEHYAKSPFTIKPSDIATRWNSEVRRRMERHTDPTPNVDPDNELAYRRALRDGRTAVAQGAVAPANIRQLTSGVSESDIRAMRQQGDLAEFIRAGMAEGKRNAAARRALILRHPDIAAKLLLPPLNYKFPEQWAGAMPPENWGGSLNNAPERKAILALVEEAEAADAKRTVGAGTQ